MESVLALGKQAKACCREINTASTQLKNDVLQRIAKKLREQTEFVLEQNALDIQTARAMGIAETMIDRLMLSAARIDAIADAALKLIELDDPVGMVEHGLVRPNGLQIQKTRVPLGVIGIIFESRPNVSVDAATLCLKAGNAVILRGGKEAIRSNRAFVSIMREALAETGLSKNIIQLVDDVSRESANQMMQLSGYLDVLIPRGGAGLIRAVVQNATVPVIETGTGNCHIYVDDSADLQMAAAIVKNAKTTRPSVCNAAESLLVHSAVAADFLPVLKPLLDEFHVELVGCERTISLLGDCVKPATEEDFATEFLDFKMSVKVVDSLQEAIDHIARFSTGHSDCIVTDCLHNAQQFTAQVDSAAVYVNASTRFTDGAEFGFGAEIGISTQKLHARGPMGLNELTSIKYIIQGTGQIR